MRMNEIMRYVEYNKEQDIRIYTPNEVFEDLQCQIKEGTDIAFAYSYLYLTNWLYRNCKYFNIAQPLDANSIKELLGYNKSNRTMNYITKKNGLLDTMGYTKTTKDYPFAYYKDDDDLFAFSTYEEYVVRDEKGKMIDDGGIPQIPKMFFLKYPVKSFKRDVVETNDEGEEYLIETDGTYNDIHSTHTVDFEVFAYCLGNKDLGTFGFYIYSWIKHKNDLFEGAYEKSLEKLSKELGINRNTLNKYMKFLKGYRLLDFDLNMECFVVDLSENERKANSYTANHFSSFSDTFLDYEKMPVMTRWDFYGGEHFVPEERIKFDFADLPY